MDKENYSHPTNSIVAVRWPVFPHGARIPQATLETRGLLQPNAGGVK